jgi:hypothetical protein
VARSVPYGSVGLTFDQLEAAAPSHHYPRDRCPPLGVVLREEVERGRVERLSDGRFMLRRERFKPAVLRALERPALDD